MAIWKAKFAQALLNKENVNNLPDISSFYKPMVAKIGPLQVAKFMESNAVDYPELKGSSSYKKVRTMPMLILFKRFQTTHPNCKNFIFNF